MELKDLEAVIESTNALKDMLITSLKNGTSNREEKLRCISAMNLELIMLANFVGVNPEETGKYIEESLEEMSYGIC